MVGDGWRRDREGSGEDGSDEGGEEEEEEGEVAASFEWKHLDCRLEMFDEVKWSANNESDTGDDILLSSNGGEG